VLLSLLSAGCTRAVRPAEVAPATAASPANCEKTTGYDVIIVGAGLSGLTAAKELKRGREDLNVLILEATDRIGGRARTLKKGPPIDLGGAWIHGVPTNPLTGIVDSLGFKRITTHLEVPYYTDKGQAAPTKAREFLDANTYFEQMLGEAARRQHSLEACQEAFQLMSAAQWPQVSRLAAYCEELKKTASDKAEDYLPLNSEYRALLSANSGPLESTAEISQTSTVDAAEFEADDDALVEKGMGTFVETYGQGLPVCLNSPVTNITYGQEGVGVEIAGGKRYQARKAIVTVSTGVLKAGKIKFDPPLPPKKVEAIQGLPMGVMQKVIIDFKDRADLLSEKDANSWVLYKGPDNAVMAFVIKPLDKNIAIGFYGGEQAVRYEEQCKGAMGEKPLPPERQPCDEQAVQRAREALGNMYGPRVSKAVDTADIYLTRWSLEPWTLGAYTAARPGDWLMREELAKPLPLRQDETDKTPYRVFFAGEACSSSMYNGSFAGAYESGLKAARSILQHLVEEEPRRPMSRAAPAP
jgi:monoamine oxidase